jgi:hypothetical protein
VTVLEGVGNLAVSIMAVTYRGLYLVGSKRDRRIRAVHIVNSAGKSITLRLSEYISRGIEPEYKTLPWQEDVVFRPAAPTSQSSEAKRFMRWRKQNKN